MAYIGSVSNFARNVLPRLNQALDDTPVVSIQGARQTGKSTLANHIAQLRGAPVFTMDDDDIRSAALADPTGFIESAGGGLFVIDEVQRAPGLILPIKASVDRDRRPGRFLLTGSADLMRIPGAQDSLAGRAETIPLAPLSQGELSNTHDDFAGQVFNARPDDLVGWSTEFSRETLIAAITTGGYPESVARSPTRRGRWLTEYAERLLRRDLRDLGHVSSERLGSALRLIAANQSGELVTAHLARHLSVAESTAATYVDLLRSLYLIEAIPAWSRSRTNRLVRKPKLFVTDSGLCARLNQLSEADLRSPLGVNHLGGLLEGFVAAELTRQASWSEIDYTISHFRESGGPEVDLVLTGPAGAVIGIEVKATATVTDKHFSGLRRLRDRIGSDFQLGIVLHTGERAWSYGEGMIGMPVSALWELTAEGRQ